MLLIQMGKYTTVKITSQKAKKTKNLKQGGANCKH